MLFVSLPLLLVASALAHPLGFYTKEKETETTGWDTLSQGHESFKHDIQYKHSGLLEELATDGQHPEFVVMACSDSRVSPDTVFDAVPGTLFSSRSVANQFLSEDVNVQTIVGYSLEHLHSTHVIVMGHYGCGGVAVAIASPPEEPVSIPDASMQAWVAPIRELFATSEREEIVAFREATSSNTTIATPSLHDAHFRALVEENVKQGVNNVATSELLADLWADEEMDPIFVYGLVYDIEDGSVYNLNVSVGPPGYDIPEVPFPTVYL